jgi:cyanophycin synthetase
MVTGDGQRDIAMLLAAMNEERIRRALPGTFPVEVDDNLRGTIAAEGLTLASVPEAGRQVVLRHAVNRAVGGECLSLPGRIHPSYAEVAGAACRAIEGIRVASVDMKVLDPERPAAPGNHWILEVNASSGLMPFHYPSDGPEQDISGLILDYLEARAAGREAPPPAG